MKIESSTVSTGSTRSYESVESTKVTIGEAKWVELSKKDRRDSESELTKFLTEAKQLLADQKPLVTFSGTLLTSNINTENQDVANHEDHELTLLKMMLDILLKRKNRKDNMAESISTEYSQQKIQSVSLSFDNTHPVSLGQSTPGTWIREVKASNFISETENTCYSSVGLARTQDGREISFNIDLEMSRSFTQYSNLQWSEAVVFTDPLVINLEGNPTTLSDQKFLFDLDSDGKEESISSLNQGSGYLALDKNEDGTINNGNELFGTKSGNGFADLATYDLDNNGWIDENDSIFNKLKVWLKDDQGNDKLISLSDVGIGAIYLGSAQTEFTLKSTETANVNGQIRSTGFYLKESGETGTIQQVDLSV